MVWALRKNQRIGKYRVEGRLAQGGFAEVYRALDTIEGVRVALKVPHAHVVDDELLEDFRREARLAARLDHPHILPLKNAAFIDGRFVIACPLGDRTLADRLRRRVALKTALGYGEQLLEALAHAHRLRIIHCDVKPENLILFPGDRLRLADFGIARVALHTLSASGSGTVGYMAPEQAMGKPSPRSDVFSAGLLIYRMLSGELPEWPYRWPPPRYRDLRRKLSPAMLDFLRRSLDPTPARRFSSADAMLRTFRRVKARAIRAPSSSVDRRPATGSSRDWKEVRRRQFRRQFGRALGTDGACRRCKGPVADSMTVCPWCGDDPLRTRRAKAPAIRCPRCDGALEPEWRFCPWCYGGAVGPPDGRVTRDPRYSGRCQNPDCDRKVIMPFMRYCPWCRRKVRRRWSIAGSPHHCRACGWGILRGFWSYCPWCGSAQETR